MFLFAVDSLDCADDKKFIENIYNKYMPWIRLRAHKQINDMNICYDLAHDCMFNLIKHIDKLKSLSEDKQRAYIAVSIDNITKNYLKREKRMITMKDDYSADLDYIADDFDIEDEIDKKFDYETIKAAFDRLCDRDRDILIMKYDLELEEQQIADVLQIKKDCVRMTVLRSVKKLKIEIAKLEGK